MAKVTGFQWVGEVRLTRRQIVSLGILAEYAQNIVSELKKGFPSGLADMSEEAVLEAFHEFRRMYITDRDLYKKLTVLVESVNNTAASQTAREDSENG